MKVVIAAPAREQANIIDGWWRDNRPGAPELFARELLAASRRLATTPEIGSPFVERAGVLVRRVLLRKSRHHVYYELDHESGTVTILAIWGAPKGEGPPL